MHYMDMLQSIDWQEFVYLCARDRAAGAPGGAAFTSNRVATCPFMTAKLGAGRESRDFGWFLQATGRGLRALLVVGVCYCFVWAADICVEGVAGLRLL